MPTNKIAQKVHRILVRAAPENLHQVPELVRRAIDENIDDDELLNVICHRYRVARDGWPTDPQERRKAKLYRFFKNNDPTQVHKADILLKQQGISEVELMQKLYQTYKKDELGDPVDDDEWLAAKLKHVFTCVAPEKIGDIPRFVSRRRQSGVDRHVYFESVCEDLGVGTDGWPNDPTERRRARLIRFFMTNAPEDLRKVEVLATVAMTEQAVFNELFERYGRDEFGVPVKSKQKIRDKLTRFLMAAAPEQLENIDALLEYQESGGYNDDELMAMVEEQYNAAPDGWPKDKDRRLQSRVRRFFMTNAPHDMRKADALCKLKGISEDEIMRQLYKKYGFNEFGEPVLDHEAEMRDRLVEFYEQFVPHEDIPQLVDQALSLRLPEEELMRLLKQRYEGIEPKVNELREKLKLIYRRAAPDCLHQVAYLVDLKRKDDLSDDDVIKTVCEKYEVDADGWPLDPAQRRRRRLVLFFGNNDPDRLAEVDELCAAMQRAADARTSLVSNTSMAAERASTTSGGGGGGGTATDADDGAITEEKLMKSLFAQYGRDELGDEVQPTELGSSNADDDGGDFDPEGDANLMLDEESGQPDGSASMIAGSMSGRRRTPRHRRSRQPSGAASLSGDALMDTDVDDDGSVSMERLERMRDGGHHHHHHHGRGRATAAFAPGTTQLWPPPNQDTMEALHRTDLYKHMIQKYGGSQWSRVAAVDYNDRFSRLARQFDDGARWQEPKGIAPPVLRGAEPATSSSRASGGALGAISLDKRVAVGKLGGAEIVLSQPRGTASSGASTQSAAASAQVGRTYPTTPPIQAQNNMAAEIVSFVRNRDATREERRAAVAIATDTTGMLHPQPRDARSDATPLAKYHVLVPASLNGPLEDATHALARKSAVMGAHGGVANPDVRENDQLRRRAAAVADVAMTNARQQTLKARADALHIVNGHVSQNTAAVQANAATIGRQPAVNEGGCATGAGEYLWIADEQRFAEVFPLPPAPPPPPPENVVFDQRTGAPLRLVGERPAAPFATTRMAPASKGLVGQRIDPPTPVVARRVQFDH